MRDELAAADQEPKKDIADRKRAEEEGHQARAKVARMAAAMTMAELLASVEHEINQPLAGIIINAGTCLRMLAADPPNVEGARETARRTIRDTNRASEVVARLRAFLDQKPFAGEPADLGKSPTR